MLSSHDLLCDRQVDPLPIQGHLDSTCAYPTTRVGCKSGQCQTYTSLSMFGTELECSVVTHLQHFWPINFVPKSWGQSFSELSRNLIMGDVVGWVARRLRRPTRTRRPVTICPSVIANLLPIKAGSFQASTLPTWPVCRVSCHEEDLGPVVLDVVRGHCQRVDRVHSAHEHLCGGKNLCAISLFFSGTCCISFSHIDSACYSWTFDSYLHPLPPLSEGFPAQKQL